MAASRTKQPPEQAGSDSNLSLKCKRAIRKATIKGGYCKITIRKHDFEKDLKKGLFETLLNNLWEKVLEGIISIALVRF